ncbi:MAG: hypothetical protein QM770_13300 [Tepidisphaeraceae bacterium]
MSDVPPPLPPEHRPIQYASPYATGQTYVFGGVIGNAVMGGVVMGFAPVLGGFLAALIGGATDSVVAVAPLILAPLGVLGWGIACAFNPRWRGFLTGILIVLGLAVLGVGACFALLLGTKW